MAGLGDELSGGILIHGGFFLGPESFYAALNEMSEEERQRINMTSVLRVNHLYENEYASEELKLLQRAHARFVNACLMVTLNGGAVVVRTGHHARRSAGDVFTVREAGEEQRSWFGTAVRDMSHERSEGLLARVLSYLENKDLYVQDCLVGGTSEDAIPIRIVTETAWHSLFARVMYWPVEAESRPEFTIVHAPRFQAVPELDGTSSSAFVALVPHRRVLLVAGASYAGEIRQAVSLLSRFSRPAAGALPLSCTVNVGAGGDVAAFVGRTGNGKTALASDEGRRFVGDHEHAWTESGLVALERGCYPKVLDLSAADHPLIHECCHRFGTLLENVSLNHGSRRLMFSDRGLAENQRAAYPSAHLPGALREGRCAHPKHLFLLTRDTLGVLPPLARLTPEQAVFSFLTGYVSSLTETEWQPGDIRPSVTAKEGKALIERAAPAEYAKQFLGKVIRHGVQCWFMNTGWSGEPLGRGERVDLGLSRKLVRAVLEGSLDDVEYEADPLFLFEVLKSCPGVPASELDPRKRAADQGEYEMRANRLALDFIKGFERFELEMPESVREMVANVPLLDDDLDIMEQIGFSI